MKNSNRTFLGGITQFFCLILFTFLASLSFGQRSSIVTGKIIDKSNGEALIGAFVELDSTDIGTATDIDGHYRLSAPPGTYTLSIRYFGYEAAHFELVLEAGEVETIEYAMGEAQAMALQEIMVVATAERSSDVVMNIELRKAPYIASGITASEIRKTSDRTISDILKRVTGASIQDGKFVIIRGMNDRYNAGYLDDALLTSTESDRKAFAFDAIPASLIDNLVIIKNAVPELTGDFGGGIIKINTKAVPDRLIQSITLGAQYHSLTTGNTFSEFKRYQGEGLNIISDERDLPEFDDDGLRLSSNFPTQEEKERVAAISKDFNNDWSNTHTNAAPNARLTYSIGFPVKVGPSKNLGFIMALNYANTRRLADSEINSYDGSGQVSGFLDRGNLHNLNTGGILNINYSTPSLLLSFHNLVNVTSDFNTILRTGTGNFNDALTVQNEAHILNSNRLYNGILSLKQMIRDSLMTIEASLSYGSVQRDIPDYRIAGYTKTPDFPDYQLTLGEFFNSSSGRFHSEVDEDLYTGKLEFSKIFRGSTIRTEIKAGYFQQNRDRIFESRNFVYKGVPNDLALDPAIDLGQDNIDASKLYLVEKTANDLAYYTGDSKTQAYYLSLNQYFGRKLRAVYGLRVEDYSMDIYNHNTQQPISSIEETSYLPSINLTYHLTEKTNLRASYFNSVNRPEFRELAPFSFFVFDKNAEIRGSQDLIIADLRNVDFRFEFYPDGGQLISIGGFYKHISDPIELSLDVTQPFTTFTYQNEKAAEIIGLEFELKKRLDFITLGGFFNSMAIYANVSLIKSKLEFNEGSQARQDRPLQGQSPYLINARLQYENPDNGWSGNISFNKIGRRIAYVGVDPNFGNTRQDIYEDPRTVMDIQVGKKFGDLALKVTLGDVFHNDLIYYQDVNDDQKYNQGGENGGTNDRLMYIYNTGMTTNFGLTYTF